MELEQIILPLAFLFIAWLVFQSGTFSFVGQDKQHEDLKLSEDEIKKKYNLEKKEKQMSIAENIAQTYGGKSDEASIVGCGLDRLEEGYKRNVGQKEINAMIDFYKHYKNDFSKIEGISTKREIIKLAYMKQWEEVEALGIKILKL